MPRIRVSRRGCAARERDVAAGWNEVGMAEGTEESTNAVRELTDLSERFGDLMGTFRTG